MKIFEEVRPNTSHSVILLCIVAFLLPVAVNAIAQSFEINYLEKQAIERSEALGEIAGAVEAEAIYSYLRADHKKTF